MNRYRLRSEAIGAAVDSAAISGSARVVLHVGPFDYRVRRPRVHAFPASAVIFVALCPLWARDTADTSRRY